MDWMTDLRAIDGTVLWGLAGVLFVGWMAWLSRARLSSFLRARRLDRSVRRLGPAVLRDVSLPDGLGHHLRIDYLVLTTESLLVISLRRYPGMLFAGETLEQWAQVLGGRSHKFANPLPDLDRQIAAVRALIPEVPIRGVLVFTDGGRFPKGKPDRVLQAEELADYISPGGEVGEALQSAWAQLQAALR